jgi:c-di-GMP-binding flagellar brake protein YcgR
MKIEFPIYKLQRRNALRIRVLDEHEGRINLAGEIFEIHDISAGGLSLITPPHRINDFPKGKFFTKSALRFAGLELKVDIEVISASKIRKAELSDHKIGLRFHGLSPSAEQSIAKEAYLHTHKIWSRWL